LKITTNQIGLEKQLNVRLKFMGLLLLAFAAITVIWDFLPTAENELDELILEIENTPDPINPYLISSTFALVGSSCLFIYWKKKTALNHNG
jgi:hypothetical protein